MMKWAREFLQTDSNFYAGWLLAILFSAGTVILASLINYLIGVFKYGW